jgi:hypothetical protein
LLFERQVPEKRVSHLKFAIRSILVRRTIIEQGAAPEVGPVTSAAPNHSKTSLKPAFSQASDCPFAGMSIASFVCWSMKTAVRRIVEAIVGRDSGHVQSHLAMEARRSRRDAGSRWLAHP